MAVNGQQILPNKMMCGRKYQITNDVECNNEQKKFKEENDGSQTMYTKMLE